MLSDIHSLELLCEYTTLLRAFALKQAVALKPSTPPHRGCSFLVHEPFHYFLMLDFF